MGPLLVAIAAILWATDALVRYPLIRPGPHGGLDPTFVVFFDHALAVALLTPFMLAKFRKQLTKVSPAQWAGLFVLGGGASAIATVLFTASFRFGDGHFAIPAHVDARRPSARPTDVVELVVRFDEPVVDADALRKEAFGQQVRTLRAREDR